MPFEDFADRHIGLIPTEPVLSIVGTSSLDELIAETIPRGLRTVRPLELGAALDETEVLAELRRVASRNRVVTSLIGMGYAGTVTPPVIRRNVLENPAWYTAYTPYQAEISQGRLEALLTFQTMIADLTGLDIANASLLDEGTAAAEAMAMARRMRRGGRSMFFVDADCHPQTVAVVATRAEAVGIDVRVGDPQDAPLDEVFGILVQYPGSSGAVRAMGPLAARAAESGVVVIAAADPLALVLLRSPGEWGADIAVGSTQRFGVSLGFGGPHAAYIACREADVRSLPGRLVGVSSDTSGRRALRLTLQTREQHIRRERATSNVCTAQVLLAVMAGLYACWHGPDGLARIATRVASLTGRLAAGLAAGGRAVVNEAWFDTLTVSVPGQAGAVVAAALERGINLRRVDEDTVGVSLDETTTEEVVESVLVSFGVEGGLPPVGTDGIPAALRRRDPILTHPVFSRYRTEHDMLRYLRRLADKDLALDRTMIPLGSCTLKLNPTTAMVPVTWPEFADIHPFAPLDQAAGYVELIEGLAADLVEITGFDVASLQPNAGSQGELAGLLAIRAYHRSRGDGDRIVCLIPASAHGTNAASATMAGMSVVVVACDAAGNVDLVDLRAAVARHADHLAAIMVTYPSTHGVFEEGIREICDVVHAAGGQVYLDGANLNAMMGLIRIGELGADVSHLNLHKTFGIPHGGGGPGVGPIVAKGHLGPFLPTHPVVPEAGPATGNGPVSAAPWGSAGILPTAWAYIRLMGPGLRRASETAILAANYMAERIEPAFPVLYRGARRRVAHECIVDVRPLTKLSGITAEDVAKRLADYGIHAPTLSFPVPGTLMIEPTESESLDEIERFCSAMLSIRAEIDRVVSGEWPPDDNPLRNSPHTAEDLMADDWAHAYPRSVAAHPLGTIRTKAYFPPVGRIDELGGDRHLMCSCPPVEEYASGEPFLSLTASTGGAMVKQPRWATRDGRPEADAADEL